ncbi:hypothetical protein [Psychrobacillus psychrodurans]|uniref:hypothetical protein n=1 Tax=Psychrobacillus psychrodurans TaxID=126157 RepID=UPI003D008CB4
MKYDTNINKNYNSKPATKGDTNINKNVKKYDTNISRMIGLQNNNKHGNKNAIRKVNNKKHKPLNRKPGCLFLIVAVIVVGGIWGLGLFFDNLEEKEEKLKVESYNDEELLLIEIKDTDHDVSIKVLIEEYINENYMDGDFNTSELEDNLGAEDFNWIKEQYNNALEKLYFGEDNNKYSEYDLIKVVEDAENGMNDFESSAIENFIEIKRELLTSELDRKLFTNETNQVMHHVEQNNLAKELERKKVNEKVSGEVRDDEEIYDYMKNEYNQITNFGESYVPEIHDNLVAELASEKFGISSFEAGNIYVKMEMRGY